MKVAEPWFVTVEHDHGVTQLYEPQVHRLIRCNVWHIAGRDRDLVIDTSVGVSSVSVALGERLDKPVTAVATHMHYDHVGCLGEFDNRVMHPADAKWMDPYERAMSLRLADFDLRDIQGVTEAGYALDGPYLLTALPTSTFDIDTFATKSVQITQTVEDGDLIDLGDRAFEVLHLPGHTPGSIGLWEEATAMLFTGDAIYDGPLIDSVDESNIDDYKTTMERLASLEASVVHAGHDGSFSGPRLTQLATSYVDRR